MILIKTPVNTWNPWNPVMKKKKLANNLFPYSFLTKLAPSTTYFVSAILFKDSSLDKTTFYFVAGSIVSTLTKISSFALKPCITSLAE
jgi:hypothetical protein